MLRVLASGASNPESETSLAATRPSRSRSRTCSRSALVWGVDIGVASWEEARTKSLGATRSGRTAPQQ